MNKKTNSAPMASEKDDLTPETAKGLSRRTLCVGTGASVVMLALGTLKLIPEQALVRPPGGQDEDALVAKCIRCEKCIEACPKHVIAPSHLEDGILQTRMPVMDFYKNYCDGCADEADGRVRCVASCPTNALVLPSDTKAQDVRIGVAQVDQNYCLAYRMAGCRFCYDACVEAGFEAVYLDGNNRPMVDVDKCFGCGACESVCVSLKETSIAEGAKYRAIRVYPPKDMETLRVVK